MERLKRNKEFCQWLQAYLLAHYGWVAETMDVYEHFFKLPFDMQYGVILKWLREEKGYRIEWFTRKNGIVIFMLNKGVSDIPIGENSDFNTGLLHAINSALDSLEEGK